MSLDKRREVQKTAGKDKNGSIDDKTKRDDKTADKRDPKAAEKEKSARDESRRHATLKDEDNSDESSDDYLSSEEDTSWIQWFCSLRGNEFFVEVDEDYINDDFNLTGLSSIVPNYDYALDMILDSEPDEVLTEEQQEIIESAAEMLYGLIHARFILTSRGLAAMVEKYNNVEFGRCPRVFCQGCPVVPVGQSDVPRTNTVKIFCPKCEDIYYPKYSKHAHLDGAYFGTTFPHLMFQMYPDLVPPKPTQSYVPRIYGFKIHKPQTAHTQQPQPQPAQQAQSRQNSAGAIATPPTTAGSVNTAKGKK